MSAAPPAHHGVLLVDKETGWTSHDVVAKVRGLYGQKKVGHTGTLDPSATGLLVVCLGRATRLVEYMTGHEKVYSGTISLGLTTDTDDAEGSPLESRPVPALTAGDLRKLEGRFSGPQQQVPPQFSAVKTGGQRAYAVARRGGVAGLTARTVLIRELSLTMRDNEGIDIRVRCGAGTFIRSLARDIGEELGCGAHLSALRRESAGPFQLESAHTLAAIETLAAADRPALLLPPGSGLEEMASLAVSPDVARRLASGLPVEAPCNSPTGVPILIRTTGGILVGVATLVEGEGLRCGKVLAPLDEIELAHS
jgi:tRNA pseudouridine55 synthase